MRPRRIVREAAGDGSGTVTGWKRPAKFRNVLVKDEESGDWIVDERVDEPTVEPEFVAPAPRLVRDLDCLEALLEVVHLLVQLRGPGLSQLPDHPVPGPEILLPSGVWAQ